MRKGDTIIWMQDYGLWFMCHKEATRQKILFSELVARLCQQYNGDEKGYTTAEALYAACEDGIRRGNNNNASISQFMEMCCRKGLEMDVVASPVLQDTTTEESRTKPKTEKKGSIFDLNRDVK